MTKQKEDVFLYYREKPKIGQLQKIKKRILKSKRERSK